MTTKIKEPVRIRQKKISGGNISIYLDIYVNGRRSYEFLKLYLIPEKSKADRDRNKETLRCANAIKSQRVVDIQNGRFSINSNIEKKVKFFEYLENLIEKKNIKNKGSWHACLLHLEAYEPNRNITFSAIDKKWVKGFHEYLSTATSFRCSFKKIQAKRLQPIRENTKRYYFNMLKSCLRQAVADSIIDKNPADGIAGFKWEETTRQYLTIDEMKKLAATECRDPEVKRAFLFSCITGLRRSDIDKLTWGEVKIENGRTRLVFRQKKTGGQEYLDINEQAASLLGERTDSQSEHVFFIPMDKNTMNDNIREWALRAGIDKHLSFHCARHTFATMMLTLGTDIYTVSKLLGHHDVATTQIYAKIVDQKKREAVDIIPDIL